MHEATLVVPAEGRTRHAHMAAIIQAAEALVPRGSDTIAAMANLASLLFYSLPDLNWCGFYRAIGKRLVVGPFQGKPACQEIPFGSGVCGRAAAERKTIIVEDVTAFPGHIACDPESRSEIVVPVIYNDAVVAVLDLDSPRPGRFDRYDADLIEQIAHLLVERTM
ncbi:MAG: GAF domain-containing protein [Bacteroidota bacterium]|nr:GAF domain-containing protein [Candidatus Kapabacteria bacterium]MCS7301992.1 GAF domain-containing protein [Candidatus Kapabacteria bacterium]MCX7936552.1 GAF domain-containing protein [Chlorobiota bacterium]MDW8074745.1 GAF domain-containing protein [Bacteroidota bacterium]MDW8271384.1 GAF domain-containing protein [Bacteroidota bacterium]